MVRGEVMGKPKKWRIDCNAVHINNGGRGRTKAQKRLLLFRDQGGMCALCGGSMKLRSGGDETATIDHIMPKSLGGGNTLTNLRAAHRRCNRERGNSLSDVFVEVAGIVALRHNIKTLP